MSAADTISAMPAPAPMSSSSRSSLIRLCVECHESYQASRVTPFAHLEHFARLQQPHLSQPRYAAQLDFLSDVFLGLDRLHELLHLTADGLYTLQAASVARRDRTLYLVYLLLLLDRLPSASMGWEEVAAFVRCQPAHTMLPLLAFLFDAQLQDTWMRQQWQTVYDAGHVDGRLLHTLRQHHTQAEQLMDGLQAALQSEQARKEAMAALAGEGAAAAAAAQSNHAATTPQPFKLSQSRPKALPAPIALPATYKAREVPEAVTRSHSLQQIEQRRQQGSQARRQQAQQALDAAGPAQPALATSQRPASLARAALEEEAEERLREATRQLTFARPVPASLHQAGAEARSHKVTAASILREEGRYRRERAEEADRLLRYESEMRDEAAFQRWQSGKRAEDEQRRSEDIARRKQLMAQAQHQAAVSVHRMVQHKQRQASSSREATDRQLHERQAEEQRLQQRREESVKQLAAADEEAVQASLAGVRRRKKEAAETLAAESKQLSDERDRRSEEERAEKRRLTLRIQAMEQLAGQRARLTRVVEQSSTGGLNLLSDMSVAEMRVRLALLEDEDRQHLEAKRQRIDADKRSRADVLSAMQQQHALLRADHSQQREAERRDKRAHQQSEAARVQATMAEEGRETAARMDDRRKEVLAAAMALASQLASNKQLTGTLQQQAAHSRERAHKDMEAAAERREAGSRQREERQQRVEVEAERRKLSDLSRVRAAVKQQTAETRQAADRRLAEAGSECTRLADDETTAHSAQHRAIVEQREGLRQTRAASKPFTVQASELDVRRARQTAEQRRQAEERWKAAQRAALSLQSSRTGGRRSIAAAEEEKQQLSEHSSANDSAGLVDNLVDTRQKQQQLHEGSIAFVARPAAG